MGFSWKEVLPEIIDEPDANFEKMEVPSFPTAAAKYAIGSVMHVRLYVMHVSAFAHRYTQAERDAALLMANAAMGQLLQDNEKLETALKVAARLKGEEDPSASREQKQAQSTVSAP